jgi:hypothetical protein
VKRLALVALAGALLAFAPARADAAVGIVRAKTSLPSGPYRFGEQITADLDVLVNARLIDPDDVHADVGFDPYELVHSPQRDELADGSIVRVRFRYLLQCTSLACTTGPKVEREIAFKSAVVEYRTRKGKAWKLRVPWQSTVIVSRVRDPLFRPQTATEARQQIPLDPLLQLPASVKSPPPSYRVRPLALALVLLAAALLAILAAAVIAKPLLVVLRRSPAAAPPLSPLEQAVVAVEMAEQRQPGGAEHREALALLGRQLRRGNLTDVVNAARKLAWSEEPPTASASRALTSDVRKRMGDES